MARIPREVIEETEDILVTDPTEPDESAKMIEMLESISGDSDKKFKLYLHRASEKNRAVAAAFLNLYPPETDLRQIYDDAQTKYKGGNFVLVIREGNRMFKKAAFSVEYDKEKDLEPPSVKAGGNIDEAFDRISRSVEKSVLLDKVRDITERKSPADSGLTQIVVAMMQSQAEMLKLFMPMVLQKRDDRSSFTDLREMAVFLKNFSEGKIGEEGEVSLTDALIKALPAIAESLARRGAPPTAPSVGSAPSGVLPPPPGGSAPSGGFPPSGSVPVVRPEIPDENKHPMAIAFNRVMAEIKFSLGLPETEKLYAHILDYTENYMPGSIEEMLGQTEDDYVKWILQFDPSFSAREEFFRNIYKRALQDEQNEESLPDQAEGEIKK